MWWIHKGSGARQFAAPGSRVALRFERSAAWTPEKTPEEAPQPDQALAGTALAICVHRWSVRADDGRQFCGKCSVEREHVLAEDCWCDPRVETVHGSKEPPRGEGTPSATIKHVGGGWYELPDGTRVKGRATAEEWLAEKARQESEAGGEE